MESRKSAHKYKDTTDDWNDDSSCTLTSLPVSDLILAAHSVPATGTVKLLHLLLGLASALACNAKSWDTANPVASS